MCAIEIVGAFQEMYLLICKKYVENILNKSYRKKLY